MLMAGCGYVCPQCEGKGFIDTGEVCDYCHVNEPPISSAKQQQLEREDWIKKVHEGPCCGDAPDD